MKQKIKYILVGLLVLILVIVLIFLLVSKRNKSYEDYIGGSVVEDYYDNKHDSDIKPSEKYTTDKDINSAIEDLKVNNNYSKVEVVTEWDDIVLNAHSCEVVFDDSVIYTVTKDKKGNVYSNIGDYEYYLQMNQ